MSEAPPKPKRFIAGAVCPRCGVMDRIVVAPDGESRECIACDFSDERPVDTLQPLPTRVTRPAARRIETEAQAVRFVGVDETKDEK
jgi:uncharacterized metal-binding protein (TIGR02443 family)